MSEEPRMFKCRQCGKECPSTPGINYKPEDEEVIAQSFSCIDCLQAALKQRGPRGPRLVRPPAPADARQKRKQLLEQSREGILAAISYAVKEKIPDFALFVLDTQDPVAASLLAAGAQARPPGVAMVPVPRSVAVERLAPVLAEEEVTALLTNPPPDHVIVVAVAFGGASAIAAELRYWTDKPPPPGTPIH